MKALEHLDRALARAGVRAELYGAVMCIAINARASTKDVDGWFTQPQAVRAAARQVATELSLPDDRLNDAAKGFIPEGARFERWQSFGHLDVSIAEDRTLLAMKCAASRTEEDSNDIRLLAARLGLNTAGDVLQVVTEFYPAERLPVRARLLVEELFHDGS